MSESDLNAAMEEVDKDRDGSMSLEEMSSFFLEHEDHDDEEAKESFKMLFKEADKDEDGKLDTKEFAGLATRMASGEFHEGDKEPAVDEA